jgi:hypothetical protein
MKVAFDFMKVVKRAVLDAVFSNNFYARSADNANEIWIFSLLK